MPQVKLTKTVQVGSVVLNEGRVFEVLDEDRAGGWVIVDGCWLRREWVEDVAEVLTAEADAIRRTLDAPR